MSSHTFVRNRKTGVIFGRNPSLDKHPDCEPYFPPAPEKAVVQKEVAVTTAISGKKPKAKVSAGTGAAAAAAAAADDAVVGIALGLAADALNPADDAE